MSASSSRERRAGTDAGSCWPSESTCTTVS